MMINSGKVFVWDEIIGRAGLYAEIFGLRRDDFFNPDIRLDSLRDALWSMLHADLTDSNIHSAFQLFDTFQIRAGRERWTARVASGDPASLAMQQCINRINAYILER